MSTVAFGRFRPGPIILAGLSFLIFAPIELFVGFALHNTAIAANASHDAFDGIFFLVFGWIDQKLAESDEHRYYCRARGILGIAVALLAVVVVSLTLVFESHNDAGFDQMLAGLIIGPISFLLNRHWQQQVHHGHDHEHQRGFSVHLIGDMAGSAIATVSGVVAFVFGDGRVNFDAGIIILVVSFVVAAHEIAKIYRHIAHRATDHPSELDHDHEAHSH